jgi:transposase
MDGRTLLKRYDQVLQEAQFLRARNRELEQDLRVSGPALYRADQRIDQLEQRVAKLAAEKRLLRQRIADLTLKLKHTPKPKPSVPAFVKADVVAKGKKRPGRRAGHVAALRPMPEKVDVHQAVPVPFDDVGKPSCPHCRTQLADVQRHQRIVEDIVPSKVITTCYHTTSGYCPGCRRVVESRATERPPAADLPHAQLGLNTLATVAVMRVCYRLPLRQIARFFAQLPGLRISPGAIVKQVERLGRWLGKQYDRLRLALRLAGVVHADETGWRTNGKNGYLWTLTNADHTLYHVDRSRAPGG